MPLVTNATIERFIYRYKWRLLPLVWLAVSVPFCAFFGVVWILRQGWQGGIIFLLISMTFVLLMEWALLLGLADVYVDDSEIVRKAFGATLQRMRWIDMEELRISISRSPENGQSVRSFGFRSKAGKGNLLSRVIVFQERHDGMDALLDMVMKCANTYQLHIVDLSSR